jgi:LysM repeat protein
MGSSRGDSSWRVTPFDRRKPVFGPVRLTLGSLLLILLINALMSLFISVVVFFVLSRVYRPEPTLAGNQPAALTVPASAPSPTEIMAAESAGVPLPTPERADLYIVKAGDSLSTIAVRFGVTMQELMAANGLQNPDWIGVGQKLVIPEPGAPTPTSTVPPIPTLTETPLPFDPPTPVPSKTAETANGSGTSRPAPAAETTPQPDQAVSIDRIIGAGDLAAEAVVISNRGRLAANLDKWTLSDKGGNVFTFPNVLLWSSQATLRIHTGKGKDSPTDLYWNRTEPVWDRAGQTATLKDAKGQIVATLRP